MTLYQPIDPMQSVLEKIEQLLCAILEEWHQYRELILNAQPVDEWLRADQVMRILKICQRTLYNYTKKGIFVVKEIGRTRYYSRDSVMRRT